MAKLTREMVLRMYAKEHEHHRKFMSHEVYPVLAAMEERGLIKRTHPEIRTDMIEWRVTDAGIAARSSGD